MEHYGNLMTASFVFGTAIVTTLGLRRLLIHLGVVDVPCERSSHESIVPRGGGLVFVVPWLILALWAICVGWLPARYSVCVVMLAVVAGMSFVDDVRGLPVWMRLLTHLIASAGCVVAWAHPLAAMVGVSSSTAWIALPVMVVGVAWIINLTNFMDGIDGLAAMEGCFIAWGIAFLWGGGAEQGGGRLMAELCGAAIAGFGVVNVSRQRIFMGDVGSACLGLLICWMGVSAVCEGGASPWAVSVLPSLFIADATITLLTRICRGKHPARPHREHLYQLLTKYTGSHAAVVFGYACVNVGLVFPVAWYLQGHPSMASAIVAGFYAILAIAAVLLRIGMEWGEQRRQLPQGRSRRVLFVVTEGWYFMSHYLRLACSLRSRGIEIGVATRAGVEAERIKVAGCRVFSVPFARGVGGPVAEVVSMFWLGLAVLRFRPNVCHHIALKPIVLGSCLIRWLMPNCRVINAVTGIGFLVEESSSPIGKRMLLLKALRWAMSGKNDRVIVQNPDDGRFLVDAGCAREHSIVLIRGAGVDTESFRPCRRRSGNVTVVLAARMLAAKGVREFVQAARIIRKSNRNVRFQLLGRLDVCSPTALTEPELADLCSDGVVEWHGHVEDMNTAYGMSDIVCLPSYYGEGVPKALIEAAACGKPIITTDTPGCREVVRHRINGLLVPPRDVVALASALRILIDDEEARGRMGCAGRQIAEREFAIEHVESQWAELYGGVFNDGDTQRVASAVHAVSHYVAESKLRSPGRQVA